MVTAVWMTLMIMWWPEIAAALGRDIRVIPVLLENAVMPSADVLPERILLSRYRNAIDLVRQSVGQGTLIRWWPSCTASPIQGLTSPTCLRSPIHDDPKAVDLVSIGVLILGGAVVALLYDSNDTASQVTTSAVTTVTPTVIISVPVTSAAGGGPDSSLRRKAGTSRVR